MATNEVKHHRHVCLSARPPYGKHLNLLKLDWHTSSSPSNISDTSSFFRPYQRACALLHASFCKRLNLSVLE